MPIYEYTCRDCGAKFEQFVRTMSGQDKFNCPKCNSKQTARALSVFAVGAEGARASSAASGDMPTCGRCGGPGPCAME